MSVYRKKTISTLLRWHFLERGALAPQETKNPLKTSAKTEKPAADIDQNRNHMQNQYCSSAVLMRKNPQKILKKAPP